MAAIRLALAVAAVTVLAAGCGSESQPARVDVLPSAPPAPQNSGPIVEVVPARTQPPLDPTANPTTPLGELRSRYLPVWSSDFDWAFPPEVCGSAWALDAIAEPTIAAGAAVLNDPVTAMALSVMRYEHLVSQAMAQPDVLEQLCVAVATVGAARADALDGLASRLATRDPADDQAVYPDEVTIVATSPTGAVGVACTTLGAPVSVADDGASGADSAGHVWLGAYFLVASRGLEDTITDVSFRVSDVTGGPADSCAELDAWVDQWSRQAQEWADAGDIWAPVDRTVTVAEICDAQRGDDPGDCPQDWAQ